MGRFFKICRSGDGATGKQAAQRIHRIFEKQHSLGRLSLYRHLIWKAHRYEIARSFFYFLELFGAKRQLEAGNSATICWILKKLSAYENKTIWCSLGAVAA